MEYPVENFFNKKIWQSDLYNRIKWLILFSQTASTRFWLGLTSIGLSSMFTFSRLPFINSFEYYIMIKLMPAPVWAFFFFIHGVSLWYGLLLRKCNRFLLLTEGLLGALIWGAAGVSVTLAQGVPTDMLAGSVIAFWLLVRFPSTMEHENGV